MNQNGIIIFLLTLIVLKVCEKDIERLAELFFAIIIVMFKGLWKVIAFPLLLILMIIGAIYNIWIAFDKWVDKMIEKLELT